MLFLSRAGPITLRLGKLTIAEFVFGEIIKVDPEAERTTIDLGSLGLKRRNGLVGMAGLYYHPVMFGAKNAEEAVESWHWLFNQLGWPIEEIETEIEISALIDFIFTGIADTSIFHILALATDIRRLNSLSVDVSSKISELRKQVKGHMRSSKRLRSRDKVGSVLRVAQLSHFIADLSSETRLAIVAKKSDHDVKLGKIPNLLIDGVGIEVKCLRAVDDRADLSNRIVQGFKQSAQIVAVETGNMRKQKIADLQSTWLKVNHLETALDTVTLAAKNGRRCVLLFTGTSRGYLGRSILLKR